MRKREIGFQQERTTVQAQWRVLIALGQSEKRRQIRAIGHNDEAEHGKNAREDDARYVTHRAGLFIAQEPRHSITNERDVLIWFIWFVHSVERD